MGVIETTDPLLARAERREAIGTVGEGRAQTVIRRLFWIYCALWILEGALRKWFLPSLSAPLLIVRDPIALAALVYAFAHRRLPINGYVIALAIATIYSILVTLTIGHGSILVTAYGARITLIHIPAVFAFAAALRPGDIERFSRALLWCLLPVAVLTLGQLYSPQSAWINRGVGGDLEGSGFSGALGYFRPSGLFSFTNGNAAFFTLGFAVVVAGWIRRRIAPMGLLLLGTAGVLIAIPTSVSRTYIFSAAITVAFAVGSSVSDVRAFARILIAGASFTLLFAILLDTPWFSEAMRVLTARFENASSSEGGLQGTLVDRFLGGIYRSVIGEGQHPWYGAGLGYGTNVAAKVLAGDRGFLAAEDEWGRVIDEMGSILGLAVLLTRTWLAAHIGWRAWRAASALKSPLAWILFSVAAVPLVTGQIAQPTNLGFLVIATTITIAALPHRTLDN